jgi:hypothetical protein
MAPTGAIFFLNVLFMSAGPALVQLIAAARGAAVTGGRPNNDPSPFD